MRVRNFSLFCLFQLHSGKAKHREVTYPHLSLKMGVKEASVDEMLRTSTCNLKIFIVTFFSCRFINCNSSFSYSPGSPTCPALFGTVHFIATPHHGLFKGKRGGRPRGQQGARGQLAAGSVSLHWAAALRDDVCPW